MKLLAFRATASFVLGLLFLAGCAVGPDYHQPQVAIPPLWNETLAGGETNAAANAADWC